MQGEAGGHGVRGKAMVIDNAANRASSQQFAGYNGTKGLDPVAAQFLAPSQYSTWLPSQAGAYKTANTYYNYVKKIADDPNYFGTLPASVQQELRDGLSAAYGVLGGEAPLRGITGGATFYSTGVIPKKSIMDEHNGYGLSTARDYGKSNGHYWYGDGEAGTTKANEAIKSFKYDEAYGKLASQVLPGYKNELGFVPIGGPPQRPSDADLYGDSRSGPDKFSDAITSGVEGIGSTLRDGLLGLTGRLPDADTLQKGIDAVKSGASSVWDQLTGAAKSDDVQAYAKASGFDPMQYIIDDAYRTATGRGVDDASQAWAGSVLQNQGAQSLFDTLQNSQEGKTYQLGNFYQDALNRPIDQQGLQGWLSSGKSLPMIEAEILKSPEAQTLGIQPEEWARTYSPDILAALQQPTQTGTQGAGNLTPTIGPDGTTATQDPRLSQYGSTIQDAFNTLLHRPADAQGQDYFDQQLTAGTLDPTSLQQAIKQSHEYLSMHPEEAQTQGPRLSEYRDTVNSAFNAVLGRPVDAGGMDYFSQALQNGSIAPSALEQVLTQSPEYAQTHGPQTVGTQAPGGLTPTQGPGALTPTQGAPDALQAWEQAYDAANPDVKASGVDALTHYLTYGQGEGRAINTLGQKFDGNAYLAQNQDVAKAGIDPWLHYLTNGAKEGRAADLIGPDGTTSLVNNWLDASTLQNGEYAPLVNNAVQAGRVWSPAATPTAAAPALTPTLGAPDLTPTQGAPGMANTLNPTDFAKAWSPEEYLNANQDVKASGMDALQHYLQFGINENRAIDTKGDRLPVTFNSQAYLAQNPDVAKAGLNPLAHFLQSGADEGRQASWDGNPYSFSNLNAGGYKIPGFTPAPAANYTPLDDLVAREGPAGGPAGSSGTAGFLADQINQLNQNVQQSAAVERMLTPNGPPIPVFAQNQFAAGAAPQTAVNQNAYLNQVNTALGNMAPAAPSGASFLPKPVMSGPFW